jgi:hypothetical protein
MIPGINQGMDGMREATGGGQAAPRQQPTPQQPMPLTNRLQARGAKPTAQGPGPAVDAHQIIALYTKLDQLIAALTPGNAPQAKTYHNANLLATPQMLKTESGRVLGWAIYNTADLIRSVKFYDTYAPPIVGVEPPRLTIVLSTMRVSEVFPARPMAEFINGIWIAATTESTDAGTTDPSAGEIVVNVFYV